jgi:hypothetical protein
MNCFKAKSHDCLSHSTIHDSTIPIPSYIPSFLHSVPNMQWTVEHYLLWILLKNHQQYEQITEASIRALHETAAEILSNHQTPMTTTTAIVTRPPQPLPPSVPRQGIAQTTSTNALKTNNSKATAPPPAPPVAATTTKKATKQQPTSTAAAAAATTELTSTTAATTTTAPPPPTTTATTARPAATRPLTLLQVEVLSCDANPDLIGHTFTLHPKLRAPCWVGRSKAQKLRDRGISLPFDSEVSSTHGKFEWRGTSHSTAAFYYCDTGSTNGSYVKGPDAAVGDDPKVMEPNDPVLLQHGTELVIGKTHFKIHLCDKN